MFFEPQLTCQKLFQVLLFSGFLEGLFEDENGNINITITDNKGDVHQLRLNYTPRARSLGEDKVQGIKREMNTLKYKIVEHLRENITDQSQKDAIVECASCFDMNRRIDHLGGP